MRKEFTNYHLLIVMIGLIILGLILTANNPSAKIDYNKLAEAETQSETPQAIETIECGACGAHVNQWWYVRDMDDTCNVEVCEYCYQLFIEE